MGKAQYTVIDLTQLIYVSRTTAPLSVPALEGIVLKSRLKNTRLGLTGVLFAHGTSLMQLLEGDATAVQSVFETIRLDPRHTDVEELFRKPIARRLYPEWSMGLTDLKSNLVLDRTRMLRLIDDVRAQSNTRGYSVEARVLLRDFEQQARAA